MQKALSSYLTFKASNVLIVEKVFKKPDRNFIECIYDPVIVSSANAKQ